MESERPTSAEFAKEREQDYRRYLASLRYDEVVAREFAREERGQKAARTRRIREAERERRQALPVDYWADMKRRRVALRKAAREDRERAWREQDEREARAFALRREYADAWSDDPAANARASTAVAARVAVLKSLGDDATYDDIVAALAQEGLIRPSEASR